MKLHIEGFHAQDGVADLGQVSQQSLGIFAADGFVSDHVGEVLNTVHIQDGGIQTLTHLILQHLGHPDDTAGAASRSEAAVFVLPHIIAGITFVGFAPLV